MIYWKTNNAKHKVGDKRIVKCFLVVPTCIDEEWRCFGTAYIEQEVFAVDVGGSMEWGKYKNMWRDQHWATRDDWETKELLFP